MRKNIESTWRNKNPIIKNRYFPLFFTYKSTLNAAFLYIKDILAPESIIRGHRFGHCPDCRNDVTRSRLRRTIAVPSLRSLQVRPVAPKKRTPLRVFSFLGLRAGFGSVRPKIKRTGSPKKGAPAGRARGKSPANAAKKPCTAGRALQGFYDLSRGIRRQADAGRGAMPRGSVRPGGGNWSCCRRGLRCR